MNQKTAKLLRQFSRISGRPLKNIKQGWNGSNTETKDYLRKEMTSELWSTHVSDWRKSMELELKEAANKLTVPEDTFKGWEYGKHIPPKFVRVALQTQMRHLLEQKNNCSNK